jgi:hypothetical protein
MCRRRGLVGSAVGGSWGACEEGRGVTFWESRGRLYWDDSEVMVRLVMDGGGCVRGRPCRRRAGVSPQGEQGLACRLWTGRASLFPGISCWVPLLLQPPWPRRVCLLEYGVDRGFHELATIELADNGTDRAEDPEGVIVHLPKSGDDEPRVCSDGVFAEDVLRMSAGRGKGGGRVGPWMTDRQ